MTDTLSAGQGRIKFDPVAGLATLADWRAQFAPTQPGLTKRVRLDMDLFGQALMTILSEAELLSAVVLKQTPTIQNGLPIGLVVGANADQMRAAESGPARDCYEAAQGLARWTPDAISPPYAKDTDYVPAGFGNAANLRANAVGVIWQVGAIGVALAAVAAVGYWASKREDALASVEIERIRSMGAIDAALKIAMVQIGAGQPVDPEVYSVMQAAGASREESRSWGVPVAATVGGLALIGGGVAAAMKWGKA